MKQQLLLFSIGLFAMLYGQAQIPRLDPSFNGRGWTYVDMPKGNYYYESAIEVLPQADDKYIVVFEMNLQVILTRYHPNGTRDLSFGIDGYSRPIALSAAAAAAAQQSDGKIIVAGGSGTPKVIRFTQDGHLDHSFGEQGIATISTGSDYSYIRDLAIQSDGRILIAGSYYDPTAGKSTFALARLNVAGTSDHSFDDDGLATAEFPASSQPSSIAIQNDGKMVVAGGTDFLFGVATQFALARFNVDGSLDNSFSEDGKQITSFGYSAEAFDIAIQSNGKIIAVGQARPTEQDNNMAALASYHPDGSLDNSFSDDGKVIRGFGNYYSAAYSVALNEGKIIIAGGAFPGFIARLNPNGSLDNSFSGDGIVLTDSELPYFIPSLRLANDGKLLAVGTIDTDDGLTDFALARYHPNGLLDNSFDQDGKLTDFYQVGASAVNDIAVQEDGKIVVGGFYYRMDDLQFERSGFALARYNTDGTLDHTFGIGGIVTTNLDFNGHINAIAIQADGKIIAAGLTGFDLDFADFALARYNPDGSLDNSFGNGGKVVTDISGPNKNYINDIVIQANGKIIAVGSGGDDAGFAVVRYNPNGSLDLSFGNNGKVLTDFDTWEEATTVALLADGKIIAAGRVSGNNIEMTDYAVARYNPDGSLDNSFDEDGKTTTDILGYDLARSITIQEDGKVVVGGYSSPGSDYYATDFSLVRYNPDGSLDLSFDGDGKVTTDFAIEDRINDLAIQADGKIIAVGQTGITSDFAMARYNEDGSLDNSFDGDGTVTTDFGARDIATALAIHNGRLYVAGPSTGPAIRSVLAAYELGCVEQVYYRDRDRDGYGDASQMRKACSQPEGYVTNNTDCNDRNAVIHPGATEVCGNMRDDNCDGQIDEGCPSKPMITITDVVVYESAGKAHLTVKMSKKSDKTVKVSYRTMTGTANRFDYVQKSGVVAIHPGSQEATISIQILKDDIAEGEEYFKVELLQAYGADLHHKDDGRIIIKDAATPTLSPDLTKPATHKPERSTELSSVHKLTIKALHNPSTSYFTLQLQSAQEGPATITVTDATGRVVERRTGVAPNTTLPLGHQYRPGVYYLRVVQGGETSVLQLIKQAH